MACGPLIAVDFVSGSVDGCNWFEVERTQEHMASVMELDVCSPLDVFIWVGVDMWGK